MVDVELGEVDSGQMMNKLFLSCLNPKGKKVMELLNAS